MNLNKALIILFCLLSVLVVVTIINIDSSKSPMSIGHNYFDDDMFIKNIFLVPEIVRSYERSKGIYRQNNILFFRFVNNSCNSCLDSQLNELLLFQEELGKDRIWVYPAYPDDRNSRIQLASELAKFNYRNIPADSLLIPTYEGEKRSYFAWINDEGEMDMVFIPDRSNVFYTRQFFIEVKKKMRGQ